MQLAGPGVFGPPKDPEEAVRVLQDAQIVGVGVERFADQLIGHMGAIEIRGIDMVYPVSARRDEKGNWLPAMSPAELTQAVEDNLRHLGLSSRRALTLVTMHRSSG
jgi:pyridoxine 4-dehydrogenase